jgi:hypothetical protein
MAVQYEAISGLTNKLTNEVSYKSALHVHNFMCHRLTIRDFTSVCMTQHISACFHVTPLEDLSPSI